jgi:crossover junction endodeoxyribonuclease RusA
LQTIILPLSPTANHTYIAVGKRRIVSKTTETFRREVWLAVKQQGIKPMAGRISIAIAIFPKTLGRNDLDNRIKPALDALTIAGVWDDDSQIDFISVERHDPVKDGKMIVVISQHNKI